MINKLNIIIKNFSYTLVANLVSLIISTLVILIIPKLIGVEEYGYWQLYLFYTSYVGFLQFGWNDGIYLRYGGKEYDSLDKKLFFSQFWMLMFSQIIIAIIIATGTLLFVEGSERKFIFLMFALCTIIMGTRAMPLFLLQATNKIKEYSIITIVDRILYCILIILFLVCGVKQYKLMVIADIVGKLISLLYAMYYCKDIVFKKKSMFYFNFQETFENINVGIKLMFANIASMLIIGVVRFGIERSWDVTTFGKISLTFSISNMMMIFINAIGIVMFPILKRTNKKKLSYIYITMRDFLMCILFGALILYYPLRVVLSAWLPQYSQSLTYMALLFPMCIFEGKMSLLINTYLKTMRKEKLMLKINMITLILSLILTFSTTVILKNLNLAVVSIVVLLAFRCVLAEMLLAVMLKISLFKDTILEFFMTITFILTGWFISSWIGLYIYIIVYIIYLILKRKDINKMIRDIKTLVKSSSA